MYVLMCACAYVGGYVQAPPGLCHTTFTDRIGQFPIHVPVSLLVIVELRCLFLVIELWREFRFLCACKHTEHKHTQYELNLLPTPEK